MREIPLTKGQVALVDDEWFDYLSQWKWGAWWNPETQSYYARRGGKHSETYLMHRIVAKTPDGMICDHINHVTLDNQDHNLRNVTPVQSNMNRKPKKNSIGHPNIRPMGNGFEVRLQVKGKFKICKTFPTLELAIQNRDNFIKEYHQEFAYHGEV